MSIKINTVHKIKKELERLPPEVVIQHCLRMAKYKKDNKELLNYLLFEADNEADYIDEVKADIKEAFSEMNKETFYYAKKNIRRIHRLTTKYIKHSGLKETEVELLIFFCKQMQNCGVSFKESKVMLNLYERQIKNVDKALAAMHEDMRFDFEEDLEEVRKGV